jgi:hypothetical protein
MRKPRLSLIAVSVLAVCLGGCSSMGMDGGEGTGTGADRSAGTASQSSGAGNTPAPVGSRTGTTTCTDTTTPQDPNCPNGNPPTSATPEAPR